jgi:hypothetical protein
MRNNDPERSLETFEEMRQRMIDDATRYIEWGLENPTQVERIPTQRVGEGGFSARAQALFYAWLQQQSA